MKCRKVTHLIPLLAGSDLPAKTIAKVQNHLQYCRSCQKEYTEYQGIIQQTREWLALLKLNKKYSGFIGLFDIKELKEQACLLRELECV